MTKYLPELIEDFEKLAKEQRWDTARDYDDSFIDPQMPKALTAFAHNWHRVRELEEWCGQLESAIEHLDLWDALRSTGLLEKGNE